MSKPLVTFSIVGTIPSKKNNKRICRNRNTGQHFIASSKEHEQWHKDHLWALQQHIKRKNIPWPLSITYTFAIPNKRKFDLSNKIETINDLLVDAMIITDDNWDVIREMYIVAVLDKGNKELEVEVEIRNFEQ